MLFPLAEGHVRITFPQLAKTQRHYAHIVVVVAVVIAATSRIHTMKFFCSEAQFLSFLSGVLVPLMEGNGLGYPGSYLSFKEVSPSLWRSFQVRRSEQMLLVNLSGSSSGIVPSRYRIVLDRLPRLITPTIENNYKKVLMKLARFLLHLQKPFQSPSRLQEQSATDCSLSTVSSGKDIVQVDSLPSHSDKKKNISTRSVSWISIQSCASGYLVIGVKAERTLGGGLLLTFGMRWIPTAAAEPSWRHACVTATCPVVTSFKLLVTKRFPLSFVGTRFESVWPATVPTFSMLAKCFRMECPSSLFIQAPALPLPMFGPCRPELVRIATIPCDCTIMIPMQMSTAPPRVLAHKWRRFESRTADASTRPGKRSKWASPVECVPVFRGPRLASKIQTRRVICPIPFVLGEMLTESQVTFKPLVSQPCSRKRGLEGAGSLTTAFKRPSTACEPAVSLKVEPRTRRRRCPRRRCHKNPQPFVLGAFAAESTLRPNKKRGEKAINMIRGEENFEDEAQRTTENEEEKKELDESLHPRKKQRWSLLDDPDLNGCDLATQEAIRSLLTPGDGTNDIIIDKFLSIVAGSCSGVTTQAGKYNFGDIKLFKQRLAASPTTKEQWQAFMKTSFSSAKLSFIFVHEEDVELEYENGAHASLLVIDRTRPGQDLIIHFDSDPGTSQERQEFRECIEEIDFGSDRVKFMFGEAPLQDEDNGDCGVMTCGIAAAYAHGLKWSPVCPNQAVQKVSIEHPTDTEQLGYKLRSYVYQTVHQGIVIPGYMTAHFV